MKSSNKNVDLEELSFDELTDISAGESAWYWISVGIGATARAFYEAATGPAIRPSTYR